MNGTTRLTVESVQSVPSRRRLRAVTRGRQWTAPSSGSEPAPDAVETAVLAPGDRAAQDHGGRLERQLANLLGVTFSV